MDPNTNRLVAPTHPDMQKLMEDRVEELEEHVKDLEVLPEELEHAAKVKLKGRQEAVVSKTSGGKLSKWAAQQRKAKRQHEKSMRKAALKRDKAKKKHRRQKAKASRRKNR